MEAEELKNYMCRRIIVSLSNGQHYKGYFKKIDNGNIVLESTQYSKEKAIPVDKIISIRVLSLWDKFQSRKKFFWSKS